jgi:O-methyltransferase domain
MGPIFDSFVTRFGLGDRLSFTGGDFFADPMPEADVLVMGHILHDWDLDEKRLLLQKAYDALPDDGALNVYEAIIDDERRSNAFGLLMSLNMLIETPGGFDYTGADCRTWMRDTGFRESKSSPWSGPTRWSSGSSSRRPAWPKGRWFESSRPTETVALSLP